jgi:hypothetical protein
MNLRPEEVLVYHITDVMNLPGILAEGGLHSDVAMAQRKPTTIKTIVRRCPSGRVGIIEP